MPEDIQMPASPPELPSRSERFRLWLRNFLPAAAGVDGKELLRVVLGVALILAATGLLSRWWGQAHHAPWLFASMGATATLLIGIPSSPMAQPWPVLAGSILSGFTAWCIVQVFDDPLLTPALVVGMSIMVMLVLRCLHPPGTALAMWMALEKVHDIEILLFPVLVNLLALVVLATLYSKLTGKRYPAPQHSQQAGGAGTRNAQIGGADLDAALAQFNGVLDVSRADLEALLKVASHAAFKRTLGDLRCEDIMHRPVHAVLAQTSVKDAWALMKEHGVKALPVVDAKETVEGIVTATDFLNHMLQAAQQGLPSRLKSMVLRRPAADACVRDLMSSRVEKITNHARVIELIAVFSKGPYHHVPVVDAQGTLVGMITQTDLIRVMSEALAPAVAANGEAPTS